MERDVLASGAETGRNSMTYVLSPVALSSCLVTILCSAVSPFVVHRVFPRYCALPQKDKFIVDGVHARILHHAIVSVLSIYAIASGAVEDRFYCTSVLGFTLMQISQGYLVGDLVVYVWHEWDITSFSVILHHAACSLGFTMLLFAQGKLMFFAVCYLITEVPSFFLNIIVGFDAFKVPETCHCYQIVSKLFLLSFILVRVMAIPWRFYEVIDAILNPRAGMVVSLPLRGLGCCLAIFIDSLNIHWFFILVKAVWNKKTTKYA